MATYRPASFPRRPAPKDSNLFTETRYQLQLAYYRYEINSALYVMSPGEKLAYNMIVLSLLALLLTSVYYYFPNTLRLGVHRLGYYITGTSSTGQKFAASSGVLGLRDPAGRVLVDRSMEAAVSSLRDVGAVAASNASSAFEP
ncbi:hypothetical protein KC332_g16633 [Hortaea werneckii]|uniref:Uncharacterized protein n=2 Tax=Hortaea werneckii TaxID=91943 RepID=A0A3M7IEL9_HORWE|nr:hypothetical protein KC350_g16558 [Hortaea werneckii]OTA39983.1 hypothetical protein BTJ68_00090 [Hortaea werneckii EXF-2000]KAI6807785.1 hypothetical protein KC358_g13225 [Hortaea werneckii]KAI6816493.1 hypothetical protein KC342_g15441 [Hortaea werneckii]KAI6900587.1 hypothetical protein KC348_g16782 [Hortaea werneckii]